MKRIVFVMALLAAVSAMGQDIVQHGQVYRYIFSSSKDIVKGRPWTEFTTSSPEWKPNSVVTMSQSPGGTSLSQPAICKAPVGGEMRDAPDAADMMICFVLLPTQSGDFSITRVAKNGSTLNFAGLPHLIHVQ
jgi:hypothetical protein